MAQGRLYTFSDTVTPKRTISNLIHNVDPMDIQMISYLGTANQGKFGLQNFPNHKYEWLKDTYRLRTDAINNGAGYADDATSIVLDDSSKFKVGDVITNASNEFMLITANNTATNTLTVTRGNFGVAAAAMVDNEVITYQWSARMEGAANSDSPFTVPTSPYNYSQIMHASIDLSGSEMNASTRWGMSDPYKYQLMKWIGGGGGAPGRPGRAGDLLLDLEKTFYTNQARQQRTSSVPGVMGTFQYMVDTYAGEVKTLTGSPDVTEDDLLDLQQLIWTNGGKPNTILAGVHNKRIINGWYSADVVRERGDRTGGIVVDVIENDFGRCDVIMTRNISASKIFVMDRNTCGWVTLRDWAVEPMGKGGDSMQDEIVGEFGFVMTTPEHNGYITGTSTS